jgi:DHA1 family inner membrane transport protein
LPWVAALAPLAALAVAWLSVKLENGSPTAVSVAQACP